MDFNSLGQGSPFYILRRTDSKPVLEIGTVKSKTPPQPMYQTQAVPSAFSGLNPQQVFNITVTLDGKDEVIPSLPINVEIAERGKDTYSASREAMLQAVDAMMQASKDALNKKAYHENVLTEGEKMLEKLNPRYAEEKNQARTMVELQDRVNNQDKKLDEMRTMMDKILSAVGSK